ncbi:MAG: hypothetical protein GF307_10600 [candidate division Zixibacteria bacterium]|nr:hypothetical protein [candidate division Zixibacteria bacterium]
MVELVNYINEVGKVHKTTLKNLEPGELFMPYFGKSDSGEPAAIFIAGAFLDENSPDRIVILLKEGRCFEGFQSNTPASTYIVANSNIVIPLTVKTPMQLEPVLDNNAFKDS